MFLVNLGDGAAVFLSIFALIFTIFFTYVLFFQVKKERELHKEENAVKLEGLLTKTEISSVISSHISRHSAENVFSLILVDLDEYEELENAFGKKEAERLVAMVANKLIQTLPKNVKIGRFGVDKLLVFLKEDFDRMQAMEIAKEILNLIHQPIKIFTDTSIKMTASIGVSFYPKHGSTLKQLLQSLNVVVYMIKKNGGANVKLYSEELQQQESENLEYYYQIKEAIKNKQFMLYYQPIINIKENSVYGAEALLRWNHPELGILSPYKFMNIIEQSGDIYWVGLWGLETLIRAHEDIKIVYPNLDIRLSLNLSPKQLMNENLVMDFQKILKKHRVSGSLFTLEIIEFVLFERHNLMNSNIRKLKELGFHLAVDGIGMDYSTLAKLEELPIDIIKIDVDFLNSDEELYMKGKATALLVDFARTHHKQVIAEGVEYEEMLEKLQEFQIDIAQGYHFNKGISFDEFKGYVNEWIEQSKRENNPS